VEIFRGLPLPPATTVKVELLEAGYQVWLPILLVIFLLLIIFIFFCCWRATHKKVFSGIIIKSFNPALLLFHRSWFALIVSDPFSSAFE